MITNKCHRCGYYFNGMALSSCPRCSQGFSGPIDELFSTGKSGELGKRIQSKNLRIVAIVVALIAVVAVVASTYQSNSIPSQVEVSASDELSSDTNDTVGNYESWTPDGYFEFDVNYDIAKNATFHSNCLNENSYSTQGYCWVFKIITKNDCQSVSATLDLDNDGESIGQAFGEVFNTYAGVPILLEIDAYDNTDVSEITNGEVTEIMCNP